MFENKDNVNLHNNYSARVQCPQFALKEEIKSLKGRLFWRFLGCSIKNITAYQVTKAIEPEKLHYNNGSTSYSSKWEEYKSGNSAPQRKTVLSAERVIPGVSKWFLNPFWEILRIESIDQKQIDILVNQIKDRGILNRILKKHSENNFFTLKDSNLDKVVNFLNLKNSPDAISALALLLVNIENKSCHNILSLHLKARILVTISGILLTNSIIYPIKSCFKELYEFFERRFSYKWVTYNRRDYEIITYPRDDFLLISHHYFEGMRNHRIFLVNILKNNKLIVKDAEIPKILSKFNLLNPDVMNSYLRYLLIHSYDPSIEPKIIRLIKKHLI